MGGFIPQRISISGGGGGGSSVSGSGTAGEVAYWSSSTAITGSTTFTFDATNAFITLGDKTNTACRHAISGRDITFLSSVSGTPATINISHEDDTAGSGAGTVHTVAGTSAGDAYTLYTVTAGSSWITGLDNSESDIWKVSQGTALGTNDFFWINTSGKLFLGATGGAQFHAVAGRGFDVTYTTSGTTAYYQLVHTSNTANSGAAVYLSVAGANASDPFIGMNILSVADMTFGLDNSVSGDPIVLSRAGALGSNNVFSVFSDLIARFGNGICTKISTANVSNPPTDAELDSAFGTPGTVGEAFLGVVNDNNANTNQYLCIPCGSVWFTYAGTLAV